LAGFSTTHVTMVGLLGCAAGAGAVWVLRPSPSSAPAASAATTAPETRTVVQRIHEDCVHPEPRVEVERCEREVDLRDRLIESLERELYGDPIPWPEEVPEHYDPGSFEQDVPRILEECGANAFLVDIDCEEPPCMVMLRRESATAGAQDLSWFASCEAWKERFGTTASVSMGKIGCSDGTEEGYISLSPYWESLGEQEQENYSTRMGARWKQAEIDWPCE
jgi:hypothetical protein